MFISQTLSTKAINCRHCKHFNPEGRRGGNCQLLGVLVRGSWQACSTSALAFSPAQSRLEKKVTQPEKLQIAQLIELIPSQKLVVEQLAKRDPELAISKPLPVKFAKVAMEIG